MTSWLSVVMDNLKQIVFCVLEDDVDTLPFKDDFRGTNDVGMG